jgi:hypothetical protein
MVMDKKLLHHTLNLKRNSAVLGKSDPSGGRSGAR